MTTIRTCLIVGGGIAGLTAAIALGRRGVSCVVVELRNEPAGAAIGIQYRALNALDELGLLDRLMEVGIRRVQEDVFRYLNAKGEIVPTPPLPPEPASGPPSGVSVHRVPLAGLLRQAAEEVGAVIFDGMTIAALEQDDERVTVTLSDGTIRDFDLVVAADGVHSATRKMVFGDATVPTYTGTTMFRWIATDIPEVGPTGFYQAEHLVVLARLRDGSLYLATGREYDQPRRFTKEEARQAVRENLEEFDAPLVRELLKSLDDSTQIIVNDYFWHMLPDPWFRGRVVVIGDAAHATTAHLSSGGGMAIEDAVVLAEELSADGSLEDNLRRFVKRRFDRTNLVVNTSVELGEMLQHGEPIREQSALRSRGLAALRAPY